MNKLKEILFLKSITGVGNGRINKFYLPILHDNNDMDLLKEAVLSNEKKAGLSDVNHAIESANMAFDMFSKATDYNIYTVMDPEFRLNQSGSGSFFRRGSATIYEHQKTTAPHTGRDRQTAGFLLRRHARNCAAAGLRTLAAVGQYPV